MNSAESLAVLDNTLRARNYSRCTIKNYTESVYGFLQYAMTMPKGNEPDYYVSGYILRLKSDSNQATTINLKLAAIRFYFEHVVKKPISAKDVPNLKTPDTLPDIFSIEEMRHMLAMPMNRKHRLFLMITYGCGLRVSEAIKIRIGDLKLDRGLLYIRGKGDRDRVVAIKAIPIDLLREYMYDKESGDWLFGSQARAYHISSRTAGYYLQRACEKAKIPGRHNLHKLRHTYAGHIHEAGIDIRLIQEVLGHKDIRTTLIYTKINQERIAKMESPLSKVV